MEGLKTNLKIVRWVRLFPLVFLGVKCSDGRDIVHIL